MGGRHRLRRATFHNLLHGAFAGIPTFILNLDLSTFTAAMAKRTGQGPFAAAPIIQGDFDGAGTPDVVTFTRGSQVALNWYDNVDPYQGSIVFWWTPEKSRDATQGNDEALFNFTVNELYLKYEHDNQRFAFEAGNKGLNVAHTTVAGATYCIVARWDVNNTLDGTNYLCISIDDAHTFGSAVLPTAAAPNAAAYLGTWLGTTWTANSIIEGLTVYRRPLWDGANGTNVGNGDEINLIHAAGAGLDPCLVTGSWDVTFCLPTNSTVGALVTGTGNAWSHPHSSAVLDDTYCETAYDASAWGDEGTPVSPISIVFDGADTVINCGSGASIDDLTDNILTVDGWIRANSAEGRIVSKRLANAGWMFWVDQSTGLRGYIDCATTDAESRSGLDELAPDGQWHHVVMHFDDAGDREISLAIDGIWVNSYQVQTAGVDAIVTDAAIDLAIGADAAGGKEFDGQMAWLRISDNDRFNGTAEVDFAATVPPRIIPPADDGNTVSLWKMDEAAGAVVGDSNANANHGTLADGTWQILQDMSVDSPAARIFNWGYVWACDAANEGVTQTVAGAAGANYVLRVIAHCTSADDIRVRIWDETNGAQIGADFDFGGGSSRTAPGVALFCFELPTNARNGAVADCISFSVKVMGIANTQEVFLSQPELQLNLIDNPSLETWTGANPDIPDGWANVNLDAGDSENSAGGGAVIHSGVDAAQYNVGAASEGLKQTIANTVGDFFALGGWSYGDGAKTATLAALSSTWFNHNSASVKTIDGNITAAWVHTPGVIRAAVNPTQTALYANTAAGGARYFDDLYLFALDAVSLTVTPANQANSAEGNGVRVDGLDTLDQPIPVGKLGATRGKIKFPWTPRHGGTIMESFGVANQQICRIYFGANDYLILWQVDNTTIRLTVRVGAVQTANDWIPGAGGVVAGTTYAMEIEYKGGQCTVKQDGVIVITVTPGAGIDFGANIPNIAYWGTDHNGEQQADAVFG